jgi:hypothetical protein
MSPQKLGCPQTVQETGHLSVEFHAVAASGA